LFTGRGWVPLLEPQSDLPASETAERLAELQRIRAKWAETAAPHTPLQNQGPNRDGLYVGGWKTKSGEFLLVSDTGRVNLWAWCRCGIGDRAARARGALERRRHDRVWLGARQDVVPPPDLHGMTVT
jgi:hypothetical protein